MARIKMGLKNLDDERGFERGCGHYTNSHNEIVDRHDDYQYAGPPARDIWDRAEGEPQAGPNNDIRAYTKPTWRSGPIREKSNRSILSGYHGPLDKPTGDATTLMRDDQNRPMKAPRNQSNSSFTNVKNGVGATSGRFAKRPGRSGSQRSGA